MLSYMDDTFSSISTPSSRSRLPSAVDVFGIGPARWPGSPSPSEATHGFLSDSSQWRR